MHDHKGPALVQIGNSLRPAPKPKPVVPTDFATKFLVGLDVGSTTVKAVVVEAATDQVLWQDYQRHETKQPEKTLEFLKRMEAEIGISPQNTRMFMTGSGGGNIAEQIGAKFVQGSYGGVAGRRENASGSLFGDRAGRTGREDHRFQG